MKTYYFEDNSWFDIPGCDCCGESSYSFECYNIDKEKHPDFIQNGSSFSEEECWEDVLLHEGILKEDWERPDDWENEINMLRELMQDNGLEVVFLKQ